MPVVLKQNEMIETCFLTNVSIVICHSEVIVEPEIFAGAGILNKNILLSPAPGVFINVIAEVQTLLNFGCLDGCGIHKFEKILDPDSRILEQERSRKV